MHQAAILSKKASAAVRRPKFDMLVRLTSGSVSSHAEPAKTTSCPLALNFRLHSLPKGYTKEMLDSYESELADPSGIPIISPGNLRMEGVGVFDGCGIAFGLHEGEGMR